MSKKKRQPWSIILISVSLLLLAGFLTLFVKQSWDDEVLALKKETGFLFVNSVQGIEGRMMDRLISRNIHGGIKGDSLLFRSFVPIQDSIAQSDTFKVMAFVQEERFGVFEGDSNVQIRIAASASGKKDTEIAGSLSMIVALSGSDAKDSKKSPEAIWTMLDSNFTASMKRSSLPVGFQLIHMKKDTICPEEGMITGSYTDMASGHSYVAELSDYQGYIFKKILPELAFSLGLFGCVSLAFFTVFKNLQAQQRLSEHKDEFIQNMTHELKTPIATVGVAIEALQNFDVLNDPERSREYLEMGKLELGRLSLLVDKVLKLTHLEQSEPLFQMELIDFKVIVDEVLASMQLQFDKQKTQIHVESDGDTFPVWGDRLHLSGVVYNLFDNALKYSPGAAEISIRLINGSREVIMEVADRGLGIAPEYRERIFEKFYRIPSGNIQSVKGYGLGLTYVADVIKKHRGQINLEENPIGGSLFRINLPRSSQPH